MMMLNNAVTNSTTVQFESKKSLPLPPGFLRRNLFIPSGTYSRWKTSRTDRQGDRVTDGRTNKKTPGKLHLRFQLQSFK